MKFFSTEKVNTGRQPELDLLKAVCIVAMIFNHTLVDCAMSGGDPSNFGFFDYIGYFINEILVVLIGAVPFMMCMGIGMCYSKKQEPKHYAVRGLMLLTVAQLLNLFRNVLPNLIAYWVTDQQWFIAQTFLILQADILSFAGLSLFLMALLKKLRLPPGGIAAVGLALNFIAFGIYYFVFTPEAFAKVPENFMLSQFLGYFVLTNAESYFPLFCNFVFVATGYWIGTRYPYIEDKNGLANRILMICLPISVAYYAVRAFVGIPILPEFQSDFQYNMNPCTDAIGAILNALIFLCILYKITRLTDNKVPKLMAHFSYNINAYYCVSFLFILPMQTILMATRGQLMEDYLGMIYAVVVIVACYFVIELYKGKIKPQLQKLPSFSGMVLMVVVWSLTVATVIYANPKIEEHATIWNDYLLPDVDEAVSEDSPSDDASQDSPSDDASQGAPSKNDG